MVDLEKGEDGTLVKLKFLRPSVPKDVVGVLLPEIGCQGKLSI